MGKAYRHSPSHVCTIDFSPKRSWKFECETEQTVGWLLGGKQAYFCPAKPLIQVESTFPGPQPLLRQDVCSQNSNALECKQPLERSVYLAPKTGSAAPTWTLGVNTILPGDLCKRLPPCFLSAPTWGNLSDVGESTWEPEIQHSSLGNLRMCQRRCQPFQTPWAGWP